MAGIVGVYLDKTDTSKKAIMVEEMLTSNEKKNG